MRPAPLAITGCGAVTPAGLGLTPLGELLAGGAAGHSAPPGADAAGFPPLPVRMVPELRLADHVGRKGIRYIDRMTAFGLVASRLALDGGPALTEPERASTGVALGTSTGSTRSASAVACDTLTHARPYMVNPSQFPNIVMNSCAAQIAIWNGLRGVNSTVAAGHLSSLHALRYARMAISQGRAARLLVGGVEELCPQQAWAWYHSRTLAKDSGIGEACVLFVVEDASSARAGGRAVLAEIAACEAGHATAAGLRASLTERLASCIDRALARGGVRPDEIDNVSLAAAGGSGLAAVERQAIGQVLGRIPAETRVTRSLGDCYSASTALQVAALLALWQRRPAAGPRVGLVTSIGHDRNTGCLIVRSAH